MSGWGSYPRPPWHAIRLAYREFRKKFFTIRGKDPDLVIDEPLPVVERELGRLSFAPNWEYSYRYEGEDLNLARVEYFQGEWWQIHVRGWNDGDRTLITVHWEKEPTEHPEDHINSVGYDVDEGRKRLEQMLDATALTLEER